VSWFALLLTLAAVGEDAVIEHVFERLADKDRTIVGVSYHAVYRYEEQDLKSGKASTLGCTRRRPTRVEVTA
jgi:hypothetical protein